MSSLTIYQDGLSSVTAISNKFIDEFLPEANDAEIKVYLYLVRMISANLPTSVSDMADRFNHTEKDILRALKYWEKKEVLSLEFNDSKVLTGIRFIPGKAAEKTEKRPLAPIVPLKLVSDEPQDVKTDMERITYSRDQIKEFKNSPESQDILFPAESYLNKVLSVQDIEDLMFMHYELKFSADLIDYLLQFAVENNKKSFAYMLTVANDWSSKGITTVKAAKKYIDELKAPKKAKSQAASKNSFNQFKQNDYDFDELEKKLLSN